ncbi:MAG: hypothetical protein AB1765_02135 [Candidatus Hydrogenedentota bacterium]
MKVNISKYDILRWLLIFLAIIFIGGIGGLYFIYIKSYTEGGIMAGIGGSITIKTTTADVSDTEIIGRKNVLTMSQARELYKDIIYGQLFVPDKPRLREMQPGDGIDNDGDDVIDEELMNGADDDGDGQIDEDVKEISPDDIIGMMWPGDGIDNDKDGKIDEEIENEEDDDGDGKIDEDLKVQLKNIDLSIIELYGTIKSSKGWKAMVKLTNLAPDPNTPATRIVGIGEVIPGTEPELKVIDIKENRICLSAEGFENTWLENVITYKANPWLLNKSLLGTLGEKDSSWTLKFNARDVTKNESKK